MDRVLWSDIPAATRAALVDRCGGEPSGVTPVAAGMNSPLAVVVDTRGGPVFCKGLPLDDAPEYLRAMFEREVAALDALPPGVGPRLLWQVRAGGWWVLGIEHVPGRAADFAPGSPDLPAVAAVLARLPGLLTPCPATLGTFADRFRVWQVWDTYRAFPPPVGLPEWACEHVDELAAANAEIGELGGDTLVHSDLNAGNWLVHDGRAVVIDWAWACVGPAWVDAELWGPRLIVAGHSPEQAAGWVERAHGGRVPEHRERFALAATIAGVWLHRALQGGFRLEVAQAAMRWAQHVHEAASTAPRSVVAG